MTCLHITSATQSVTVSLARPPRSVAQTGLSKVAREVMDCLAPKVPVQRPYVIN